MPSGTRTFTLAVPIETIWDFVKDMNHWAPLIPGYVSHEINSDTQSIWILKGDLGFMTKKVKLQIDITEWAEPSKVAFDVTGLTDHLTGNGYFEAKKIDDTNTEITGFLSLEVGGTMGPMLNAMIGKFVQGVVEDLSENIATKIKEQAGIVE